MTGASGSSGKNVFTRASALSLFLWAVRMLLLIVMVDRVGIFALE